MRYLQELAFASSLGRRKRAELSGFASSLGRRKQPDQATAGILTTDTEANCSYQHLLIYYNYIEYSNMYNDYKYIQDI